MTLRRVLLISDHSDPFASLGSEESGGQNVYVDHVAALLVSHGLVVHVLTRQSDPHRPLVEKAPGGYTVYRAQVGPPGFLPKEEFSRYLPDFVRAAQALADRHAYDLVHAHYWLSGLTALALRASHGIPFVQTFHSLGKMKHAVVRGIPEDVRLERETAEGTIARNADGIIAESTDERRLLVRAYGADPRRITVIPAGVDIGQFRPGTKKAARRSLGIHHRHVVLFVGRFVAQKGIVTLLRSFALVRNDLRRAGEEDPLLILVGGDREPTAKQSKIERRVHTMIRNLRLTSCVRLAGRVGHDELPRYYRAADVCVVPSRYEPFGIVPLEAMACGTPVVASSVGGMKDTVRPLHTGFLARPQTSADFAYKTRLLLENPAMREEFSRQSRMHVEQTYAWEAVADRIHVFYRSLHTSVSPWSQSSSPRTSMVRLSRTDTRRNLPTSGTSSKRSLVSPA